MGFKLGGSSFTQGVQMGRNIYEDAQRNRRADAEEARRQADADYLAEQRSLARADRAELEDISRMGAAPPLATGVALGGTAPPLPPIDGEPIGYGLAPASASAPVAPVSVVRPPMNPAAQAERIAAVKLRQGDTQGFYASQDRAKKQKFDEEYQAYANKLITMKDDEFDAEVAKITQNEKLPAKLEFDPKTQLVTVKHDNGTQQKMPRAQAITLLMSAYEMGNGRVDEGIAKQLSIYNTRRDDARQDASAADQQTGIVARQALGVRTQDRADKNLERMEANDLARTRIAAGAAARAERRENEEKWVINPNITDKDGNAVMMSDKGNFKPAVGMRPIRDPSASAPASRKDILDAAKGFIDSGAKGTNGKPLTMDEALDKAKEYYGLGGKDTGFDLEAARTALRGGAPKPNGRPEGAPGLSVRETPSQAPTQGRTMSPAEEIAEIQAKLNATGGLGGIGGRLVRGEALNLAPSWGERRILEDRLRMLQGAR